MKFPILLCIFMHIPISCDNVILYFGLHKEPKSNIIAGMLNDMTDGIALHIPEVYIKRAIGIAIIVYVGSRLYVHRKSLISINEPIPPCMCNMCLDILSEQIEVFD